MALESLLALPKSKCPQCGGVPNLDVMMQDKTGQFMAFCHKSCRTKYLEINHPGEMAVRDAICRKCHKTETAAHGESLKDLKYCGRCKSARYCSLECQRTDWPEHKNECIKK